LNALGLFRPEDGGGLQGNHLEALGGMRQQAQAFLGEFNNEGKDRTLVFAGF